MNHLPLTSVGSCVIHFWTGGLPAAMVLGHVDVFGVWDLARARPGLMKVLGNVVSVDKVVYSNKLVENGRRQVL